MSRLSVVPARAVLDRRLTPRDLQVLAAVCIHTDLDGWCYPSHARLARMLGVSRQLVQRACTHLTACGYLEQRERRRDDGGRSSNSMRVLYDYAPPVEVMRWVPREWQDTTDTPPATPGVAPPATRGVAAPATPRVALTLHETSHVSQQHAAAPTRRAPRRAQSAAAAPQQGKSPGEGASPPPQHSGRKRKRTHPETGVVFWYDDEVAEIEALVKAHGSDPVAAVAADLRGAGTDPLPSVVAAALLARARAQGAARRANNPKRHERTPEEKAEDRRKADEAMAYYRKLLKEGS